MPKRKSFTGCFCELFFPHFSAGCDFQCTNGQCQPSENRCDGKKDCDDGIDESNCGEQATTTCMQTQFKCIESGECIDYSKRCDGIQDCPDNSDENNCQGTCTLQKW